MSLSNKKSDSPKAETVCLLHGALVSNTELCKTRKLMGFLRGQKLNDLQLALPRFIFNLSNIPEKH